MPRFASFAFASVGAATELGDILGTGSHAHADFGGDKMEEAFTKYTNLPVGEDALWQAGWTRHDRTHTYQQSCDPVLGYSWTRDASGATKSSPIVLYTTSGGQMAGVGVVILGKNGEPPLSQEQQQWATQEPVAPTRGLSTGEEFAHIDVAFRAGDIMCSGKRDSAHIGNLLRVNPKGQSYDIPLVEDAVRQKGWHRGSCFDGMGWHNFLDTKVGNGQMSGAAKNLFPVVAMYHQGEINAIFFATPINQVSIPIIQANGWEPKALSSDEMCMNDCDSNCHFDGLTSAGPFSTMHVYFRDHKEVECDRSLTCKMTNLIVGHAACCESQSIEV